MNVSRLNIQKNKVSGNGGYMKKLDKQDIIDILTGCIILGTGGGGDFDAGMALIEEAEALGKEFILVDVNEIPDDAILMTPYLLGALTGYECEKTKHIPKTEEKPILLAVNKMENYLDTSVYGTVSCELGGENTAIPMYVAAMKGSYIVDADIAGRAVPEVTNSTYYINGLPAAPVVVANAFGETVIIEELHDDARSEQVLRSFAQSSNNSLSAVDHAMPCKDIKHALIPNTISRAQKLGQVFREAKENEKDVASAVAESMAGKKVFEGQVIDFTWDTVDGFTEGFVDIEDHDGNEMKIWFKNENLMSWLNGQIFVTLPDLICLFNQDNKTPIQTPDFKVGMTMAVVIIDAPDAFKTEKGLEAFGPKRFGYDVDYDPALGRII